MLNNLLNFNNSSSSIISSNNVETLIPVNNALTLENGINEPILKNILSLNFLYNIEMSSKEQLQLLTAEQLQLFTQKHIKVFPEL
ncbi:hypothetical protein [Spiroplasma endosymbiont of Amphimallon solstitiale]|uniref:hypothetical protein n=1 Tax=Spiroplasma endosymbiont of Amphimallon solstitiale TaxID=3066288 RepID=UPI00313E5E9C